MKKIIIKIIAQVKEMKKMIKATAMRNIYISPGTTIIETNSHKVLVSQFGIYYY